MEKGYSQSVGFDNGQYKASYIYGQVSVDAEGQLVGKIDFVLQVEQVFKNIKSQMEKNDGKRMIYLILTVILRKLPCISAIDQAS